MDGSGQVWEVVGGADKGGVVVRIARDLNSPQETERLATGTLVMQVELVGDRLRYDRIAGTGTGPDSGWVSIRFGRKDLLVPADIKPPRGGWRVLHKELPAWVPGAEREALPALTAGDEAPGPNMSVAKPQCPQTPGEPYVYYHQVAFADTKPTGLRMSACLCSMDECRTDLFTICDQSVESFRHVTDPFTQVIIELRPAIAKLGKESDGLLYNHPNSNGLIQSWLRLEAQFGWPMFPLRNEEMNVYLVGKQRSSSQRELLATARLLLAFVDEGLETPAMLQGEKWEMEADRFWGRVKRDHSSLHLNERQLHKLYPSSGLPFTPTAFKKVTWLMTHSFGDLWSLLFHAKTPELLWDVNMLAGGPFKELVQEEADPQAMAVNLPKKMEVGTVYDVHCFLDEHIRKAMYLILPEGKSGVSDAVLAVCATYNWRGAPEDGRSLTSEDIEGTNTAPRNLAGFASGAEVKPGRLFDLSKLPRPA